MPPPHVSAPTATEPAVEAWWLRLVGSAMAALSVAGALRQAGVAPLHPAWAVLTLQLLAWPLLAYLRVRRAGADRVAVERDNVRIDTLMVCLWLPPTGFNLFPAALLLSVTGQTAAALGGVREMLRLLPAAAAGVGLGSLLLRSPWTPAPDLWTCLACLPMLGYYPLRLGAASYRLSQRLHERRKEVERVAAGHRETLDALDATIVLYDADDRLVFANRAYRALFPGLADLHGGRPAFADVMREMLARGLVADVTPDRHAAWLAERLALHRAPHSTMHRQLPGGHWRRVVERRLPDGGTIAYSVDVTEIERASAERRAAAAELQRVNERLARLSETDGLTGLANRRHFDDCLRSAWQRCAADGQTLALVFLDIDHFKRFNDVHGHLAGDDCLCRAGAALRDALRRDDALAARYGGEEFVLLLPAVGEAEAAQVAERCLAALRDAAIPHPGTPAGVVTASAGVAAARAHGTHAEALALLCAADAALYVAKAAGRGRVARADPVAGP